MQINNHKINLSEEALDKIINEQTIKIVMIDKKSPLYQTLKDNDKKALEHLTKAGKILNNVNLRQDHHLNLEQKKALKIAAGNDKYAQKALQFFNMFNGVEGLNGIDLQPIELFEGIKGYAGRNFYPHDMSVEEFHNIIHNMLKEKKFEQVQKILSNRTMVLRKNNELEAIDYTTYFATEFLEIAQELNFAKELVSDQKFGQYLKAQALALQNNDEKLDEKADKLWAELQDTDLEFTISRENYEDEMTTTLFENKAIMELINQAGIEINSKDMLGVRVGIINKEGTNLIMKFKEKMKDLANLMPFADTYEQSIANTGEIKQTMVDADLLGLYGDYAACRGGITTAQNLPNNDKLSIKNGGGRRNVYHRQVRQASNPEREAKILEMLVDKNLHQYFNLETDHLFVIGHENGHSLGPNSVYQNALGIYKHIIEEHKADVISIAFMPEYLKAGVISAQELKEIWATWVIFRLFISAEPHFSKPHRIADLIQFNYLLQNNAIYFDDNGKLYIDFIKFEATIKQLLEETIKVQLSKKPEIAKEFIEKYAVWGQESKRIAKIQKELGLKPYKQIVCDF